MLILLVLINGVVAQQQHSLPVQLPQVAIQGRSDGACASDESVEQAQSSTKMEIRSIVHDTVIPALDLHRRCPCGDPGQWHRIAHLNMSDPDQQCPSNWQLITTPVRGCGRRSTVASCDSTVFPSNGISYSRVCGRIDAIQHGAPGAFHLTTNANPGLEGIYIEGISLTHGVAGSRQHIWTFAAALYETDPSYAPVFNCPCTNTNINWPYQIPSYIGDNYFCDTGNPGPGYSQTITYTDDPLWDGEGCGPTSTCCQLNNPPWFCTTLPQPTTDDIELRICADTGRSEEDFPIQLVEIYTQ